MWDVDSAEANKEIVRQLAIVAAAEGPEAAFRKYCGPDYVQHNPRLVDGMAGFVEFFSMVAALKGFSFTIKRMASEDDLVWMQGESTGFHWPDEPAPIDPSALRHAWMDIFRIRDGRIVEHWDVYQRIPSATASGNPMA